jgi:protein-S-isoprenylcysteine O-methyltransferase Ste14
MALSSLIIILLVVRTYYSKLSELTIKNPMIGNTLHEQLIVFCGIISITGGILHTNPITSVNEIIGSLIFLFGIYLLHLTHYEMGSSFSPRIDIDPERKLVNTGIFSLIRHPMYLSVIFFTIGIWFMTKNMLLRISWLLFTILLLIRIPTEEEYLTTHFYEYNEKMPKYKILPLIF